MDYELTEHTADLGIAVTGRDWEDLLARCAVALADLQYDPTRVEKRMSRDVGLDRAEGDTLLVRWLNELIGCREVEDFLWREVEVEVSQTQVRARLHGEPFDASRHRVRSGLKAAPITSFESRRFRRDCWHGSCSMCEGDDDERTQADSVETAR